MTASEEEERDYGGNLPATDDWPRGVGNASWWPITIAVGAIGFIVGVGVYLIGSNVGAIVNPTLGIVMSLSGIVVAVSGVAGWVYHGFIAHRGNPNVDPPVNKYLWGMLLYFPVELSLIGGGVLYFTFIYFGSWPPGDLPQIFTPLVWVMTAILLVSSFTNYLAGRELRNGNERRFLAFLAATPILGVLFLVGKAFNWHRLIVHEGYTIGSGVYWTAFFSIGGFHALLVIAGIVVMSVVFVRALAGHYSPQQHISVTTASWYWWIVDSVWLILVVELYGTVALCRAAGTC